MKLLEYVAKINRCQDTYHKKTLSFFNNKFVFGYSAKQKKDAANALKSVVLEGADQSCLDAHQDVLNNGELKSIFYNLR